MSLLKETDFTNEANNSDLAKQLLEDKKNVYIPKIFREYSSKRVMTAEWIDGVKLNDSEALNKLGVSSTYAVHQLIQFIAHQIFVTGHVHSDPHPGL